MKRKIVQHGNSTLSLSLPSKWVKSNNIQKGQFLNIDIAERGLVISQEKIKFSSIEINLSNEKEWYINRILSHLYTYGFDEIKINYTEQKQLSLIRKMLAELTGFEIVESNPKYCIIKAVASIDTIEFDNNIKRILFQILSQFDYFIEDIEKKSYSNFDETLEIHKVVTKLINLSKRLINKNLVFGKNTSKYAYNFLIGLLNISRSIIYSYKYAKTNNSKLNEIESNLIKKTRDFYQELMGAYQNQDMIKIKSFLDERETISEDSLEILKEKNPVVIHFFLDMFKEFSAISNFVIILNTNRENKTEN